MQGACGPLSFLSMNSGNIQNTKDGMQQKQYRLLQLFVLLLLFMLLPQLLLLPLLLQLLLLVLLREHLYYCYNYTPLLPVLLD